MMALRTAIVAGATGVAGRNLLAHLIAQRGWDVIAVSRRLPDVAGDYRHIPTDLLDPQDCAAKLGAPFGVTHVFFAAYVEGRDPASSVAPNVAMLANLLDVIEPASPALAHIHLMEGTKWYGSHLGPFKTPAREDDARRPGPNFYYDQQDLLVTRQRGKRWTWSAARPHAICGFATGNPMNLVMVLAVYATLARELGLPFHHPGTAANYHALYQVTDSALLARASVWMASDPACANEAFNITNGDLFRWEAMWPRIARYFGLTPVGSHPLNLNEAMADKGPAWAHIVAKYGLREIPYERIVSWRYGDFAFGSGYDIISSTIKAKLHGFHDVVDSEAMFFRLFGELRGNRIIP